MPFCYSTETPGHFKSWNEARLARLEILFSCSSQPVLMDTLRVEAWWISIWRGIWAKFGEFDSALSSSWSFWWPLSFCQAQITEGKGKVDGTIISWGKVVHLGFWDPSCSKLWTFPISWRRKRAGAGGGGEQGEGSWEHFPASWKALKAGAPGRPYKVGSQWLSLHPRSSGAFRCDACLATYSWSAKHSELSTQ